MKPLSLSRTLGLLVSALTVAVGIRFGTFTPWGSDAAGYIEAGRRWSTGELMTPAPLHFWPPLVDQGLVVSPFAFRPGAIRGTEVSLYPLGFPVLLGAATTLGGDLAAYMVPPIFAGLLVWCVYSIAAFAAGNYAALIAALLIAASPVTLFYAITPMSDVPATALWALAWMLALRPGNLAAVAAGAVTAFAVMVRPHLAPLGLVPFVLLVVSNRAKQLDRLQRWRRLALFVAVAAAGPIFVAWSQSVLYGSLMTPGYIGWDSFFRLEHVSVNALLLPRQLLEGQGPWIFLGLAAPLFLLTRAQRRMVPAGTKRIVGSAFMVLTLNYLVYLPYMPIDNVFFVRFMLPALTALCVLHAIVVARLAQQLRAWSRWLVAMAIVPAVMIVVHTAPLVRYSFDNHKEQARVRLMGEYLRAALPLKAAVFTSLQGGAIAHYTRAQIVRYDLLQPGTLDLWVDRLARRGYQPVLILEEAWEMSALQAHASATDAKYRWIPRAEFRSTSAILYFTAVIRGSPDDTNGAPVDVIQ